MKKWTRKDFLITYLLLLLFSFGYAQQDSLLLGDWKQTEKIQVRGNGDTVIDSWETPHGFSFLKGNKIMAYPFRLWRGGQLYDWQYGFSYAIKKQKLTYDDEQEKKNILLDIVSLTKDTLVIVRDNVSETYFKVEYYDDTTTKIDQICYRYSSGFWNHDKGYFISIDAKGNMLLLNYGDTHFGNNTLCQSNIPTWLFDTLAVTMRKSVLPYPFHNFNCCDGPEEYTTFSYNNKIIDTLNTKPSNREWMQSWCAYALINDIAHNAFWKETEIPFDAIMPLPAKLLNKKDTINLLPSESFYLFTLLINGSAATNHFKPTYELGYYNVLPNKTSIALDSLMNKATNMIPNANGVIDITASASDFIDPYRIIAFETNGRLYRIKYSNGTSRNIDIGFNFIESMGKKR